MEEQIKKAVRFVRMSYLVFWRVPVVFVLVGETTALWEAAYADDVRTTYYAETLSILLAAACVPLSLKLFAWVLYRRIDRAGIARALQLYVFWSGIRLVLLALPLMAGFLTYYGMLSTTGLLCALIALTASLFCLPGEERLRRELHIEREEGGFLAGAISRGRWCASGRWSRKTSTCSTAWRTTRRRGTCPTSPCPIRAMY